MFNKIYDTFSFLSGKQLSQEHLDILILGAKHISLVEGMFKDFIDRKLRDKISEEDLSNILSNLDLPELYSYQKVFNNSVIATFVFRKHYDNYFYFCLEYSENSNRSIFKDDFLRCLANSISIRDASEIIKKISKGDKEKKNIMLLSMAAMRKDAMSLQADRLLDSLDLVDKIDLIIHSFRFPDLLDAFQYCLDQDEMHDVLTSIIIELGDRAPIALKVRENTLLVLVLRRMNPLMELLLSNGSHIPLTMKFLFDCAVKEECWELLVDLGRSFSKKDILKALTKCPNKQMITSFIVRYKDDPEVKRLIPFI